MAVKNTCICITLVYNVMLLAVSSFIRLRHVLAVSSFIISRRVLVVSSLITLRCAFRGINVHYITVCFKQYHRSTYNVVLLAVSLFIILRHAFSIAIIYYTTVCF